MGRKIDGLLKGFLATKCLTLLKVTISRIKLLRNKGSITAKQMRSEIAQLLKSGQDAHVYITKADTLIKEENMVAAYGLIDQFCHSIISRFPIIETQSNCPIDMKEPIASLIFAAPRCAELGELIHIKDMFTAKYGKEFAAAAAELRPECGVNRQIIENLSTHPASEQMKLKLVREICVENNIEWTRDAIMEPPKNFKDGSSQRVEAKADVVRVADDEVSTKSQLEEATYLRMTEAGSSNMYLSAKAQSQKGLRQTGSSSFGPAATPGSLKTGDEPMPAADVRSRFQPSAAASSEFGTNRGPFSLEEVARFNVTASESFQGLMDEGVSSSNAGFLGSLKGVTEFQAEDHHEDRVEYRSSLRQESLRASREGNSSVESSHEGNSLRASRLNSLNVEELHEEKYLSKKKLAEEQSFRASRENNGSKIENSFRASRENSLNMKKLAEEKKVASPSASMYIEQTSFQASKENFLNLKKPLETAIEQFSRVSSVPALEKAMQEPVPSSSSIPVNPENNHDFATTAQAIAAEAARLALLDYTRRYARSSSISVEHGDLTNSGLENMKAKQAENLNIKGKQATSGSQRSHDDGDDSMNAMGYTWDVPKEKPKKFSKTTVFDDDDDYDGGNMDGMGYRLDVTKEKSKHSSNMSVIGDDDYDDNINGMGYRWDVTKNEAKQASKMAAVDLGMNPIPTKTAAGPNEEINSFSLNTGADEGISRVLMSKLGSVKKAGGMAKQEEEDFERQTHRRPAEKPRFDEGRHSSVKVKASFDEENAPSYSYGKHKSNLQDKVAGRPTFEQVSYLQNQFSEEGSKLYKRPVYDGGPDSHKTTFSFDDCLDEGMISDGICGQKLGHESSSKFKASTSSYLIEPGPYCDEVAKEGKQPSMNQMKSQHVGQLRWNSQNIAKAQREDQYHDEEVTTGETWGRLLSMSDASTGNASHAKGRTSARREPRRMDEHDYDSETVVGAKWAAVGGSSSSHAMSKRPSKSPTRFAQQHQMEQEESENYSEKVKWETRPVESLADSGLVMSKQSSSSPKRASQRRQKDLILDEALLEKWDATSITSVTAAESHLMSKGTTKSATRLAQGQQARLEESTEVRGYAEEKTWEASSAGSRSMSQRATRTATSWLAQQQQQVTPLQGNTAALMADHSGEAMSKRSSRSEHATEEVIDTKSQASPTASAAALGGSGQIRKLQPAQQHKVLQETLQQPFEKSPSLLRGTERGYASSLMAQTEAHEKPSVRVDHDLSKKTSTPSRPLSVRQQQRRQEVEQTPAASVYKPYVHVDDISSTKNSSSAASGRRQQSLSEEEAGASSPKRASAAKLDAKAQPPARPPPPVPFRPRPRSPPLASSLSDPVILATTPPTPLTPPPAAATKLATSSSAPAASTTSSAAASTATGAAADTRAKSNQKAPDIDVLAARFEAFRRARLGGEGPPPS